MRAPSTSTLDSLEEAPPQCEQATSPNSSTSMFHGPSPPRAPRIRIRSSQLPLYTVDLSLPPVKRYTQICHDFRDSLAEFTHLYHAVLELATSDRQLPFPFSTLKRGAVRVLAKMVLRRVYSKEESEEIKGIHKATGMKLEEVVGLNTFLDLFCGCVSGGVKAGRTSLEEPDDAPTMLHFRGLDWEMDSLRDLLIQVQYVRDGQVVARAVTYAGYVGTLTGVREGLSMSMNYRLRFLTSPPTASTPADSPSKPPKRSKSSLFRYRFHQLLLLFGLRPSIASQLRTLLLSPGPAPTLDEVQDWFQSEGGSPSYLTFCSTDEVLIIENDLVKRQSRSSKPHTSTSATPATPAPTPSSSRTIPATYRSDTFLAVTNHDRALESLVNSPESLSWTDILRQHGFDDGDGHEKIGMAWKIMESSIQRKKCVERLYQECLEKVDEGEGEVDNFENVANEDGNTKQNLNLGEESESESELAAEQSSPSQPPFPSPPSNVAAAQPELNPTPPPSTKTETETARDKVEVEDIKTWLRTYPLRNETTHFSCIMDPSAPDGGAIVWVEACEEV